MTVPPVFIDAALEVAYTLPSPAAVLPARSSTRRIRPSPCSRAASQRTSRSLGNRTVRSDSQRRHPCHPAHFPPAHSRPSLLPSQPIVTGGYIYPPCFCDDEVLSQPIVTPVTTYTIKDLSNYRHSHNHCHNHRHRLIFTTVNNVLMSDDSAGPNGTLSRPDPAGSPRYPCHQ